jgi:hypothetical protein
VTGSDEVRTDEQSPCPACGAPATESTDPEHLWRSICSCGHPRYYDYRLDQLRPLPTGATGFLPLGDWTPPDLRRVLGIVHEAGRSEVRTVGDLTDAPTLRSFRYVELAHRHEPSIWALFHNVVAVVAFTDVNPKHELCVGHYLIDWRALPSDRVADGVWVLLTRERALERPKAADFVDLSPDEIAQIRYWRPATIGQILFNHWD